MAPSPLQQRRTHNTLLFQKLLSLRDGASPFTLILDTLEQSGASTVQEFARRAKISKSKVVFISFSTLQKQVSFDVDAFVSTRGKALSVLQAEILSHLPQASTRPPSSSTPQTKYLLIIDNLYPLSSNHLPHLSAFLSSLLISPQISLLATYHQDIPLHTPSTLTYSPSALTILTYLSTAILTISSLPQTLAQKRARDKSLQEPVFGLAEHREGLLFSLTQATTAEKGIVVAMELRRRSGRGIIETFVLYPSPSPALKIGEFILLHDHPLYSSSPIGSSTDVVGDEADAETTFSLGLTEKQKRDRDGVVLPYFDAQKEGGAAGPGEGGRILYDMGSEDREDFDDEEDEI